MSRGPWLTFLTKMRLAEDTPKDRAQWGSDPLSLPAAAVTKSHRPRGFSDRVLSPNSGAQKSKIRCRRETLPRTSLLGVSMADFSPCLHAILSLHTSCPNSPSFTRTPVLLGQDPPWWLHLHLTAPVKTWPPNKATL